MRKFGLLTCAIVALVLVAGCGHSMADQREYRVKYLQGTPGRERNYHGLGHVKVMAYDTRTGDRSRLNEPFYDQVRVGWCKEWYLRLDDRPRNSVQQESSNEWFSFLQTKDWLGVDWMQEPGIKAILSDLQTPGVELGVRVWDFGSCHPPTGRLAITGNVSDNPDDDMQPIAAFLGVLEPATGEVLIIREERFEGRHPSYYRPFFDSEGKHLYYSWTGRGMRFNIETQALDTIAAGDIPVIAWNKPAVIVYSSGDEQYKLLDQDLNVQSSIDSDFEGTMLSAFAIDEHTCLIATTYKTRAGGAFGKDLTTRAAMLELDFQQGSVREIMRSLSPIIQILDVQTVE